MQLAIILGDQTIKLDKGQAELLLDLTQELLPHKMDYMLEQAHLAIAQEDENAENAKKTEQLNILENIYNLVKQNYAADDLIKTRNNFVSIIEIIKNYIKETNPAVITDNRYFLSDASACHAEYLSFSYSRMANKISNHRFGS
ncbi:MAG: hypothetical protein ABI597_00840 [Gammaproteobacteria bacterium]